MIFVWEVQSPKPLENITQVLLFVWRHSVSITVIQYCGYCNNINNNNSNTWNILASYFVCVFFASQPSTQKHFHWYSERVIHVWHQKKLPFSKNGNISSPPPPIPSRLGVLILAMWCWIVIPLALGYILFFRGSIQWVSADCSFPRGARGTFCSRSVLYFYHSSVYFPSEFHYLFP